MTRPCFHQVTARSGDASLQVELGSLRLWVHSPVDPRAEAARQLDRLDLDGRTLLVVVGGGLGWLARVAQGRPCAGILLLEPEANQAELCQGKGVEQRVGAPDGLIAWVTERQMALGWPDLAVVHNPAYGRAFPGWAERLVEALPPGRHHSFLGARRVERGSVWLPRRVLLLDSGYYLLRECREALEEMGLATISVPLRSGAAQDPATSGSDSGADANYLDRLLEAVVRGRPDLVLTVNHLGLDQAGKVQDLLDSLRLPLAVWYVDSPEFILDGAAAAVKEDTHLFCWERAWIPHLRGLGFRHVTHLPLAGSRSFQRQGRPRSDFSLVAGSNAGAIDKWRRRLGCPAIHERELKHLLGRARDMPRGELPDLWLQWELGEWGSGAFRDWLTVERARHLRSLLVLRATQEDRVALATRFGATDFVLHGDAGWAALRPGIPVSAPLDYYRGLADHYAGVRVSLNTTSRQMPGTVNQRLFDAPLSGSVVLTDVQPDLAELFEPGLELAVYHNVDEALAVGRDLVASESIRLAMVERARTRILGEHRYCHRLEFMLKEIGRALGRGRGHVTAVGA